VPREGDRHVDVPARDRPVQHPLGVVGALLVLAETGGMRTEPHLVVEEVHQLVDGDASGTFLDGPQVGRVLAGRDEDHRRPGERSGSEAHEARAEADLGYRRTDRVAATSAPGPHDPSLEAGRGIRGYVDAEGPVLELAVAEHPASVAVDEHGEARIRVGEGQHHLRELIQRTQIDLDRRVAAHLDIDPDGVEPPLGLDREVVVEPEEELRDSAGVDRLRRTATPDVDRGHLAGRGDSTRLRVPAAELEIRDLLRELGATLGRCDRPGEVLGWVGQLTSREQHRRSREGCGDQRSSPHAHVCQHGTDVRDDATAARTAPSRSYDHVGLRSRTGLVVGCSPRQNAPEGFPMAMVLVPRERTAGERRVAATPETVRALAGLGWEVQVERDAGAEARFTDADYREAGAEIAPEGSVPWGDAALVLAVSAPAPEHVAEVSEGAAVIGLLAPHRNRAVVRTLAERKAVTLAMELIPRITRAQRMDALSSQANIAGYRAAILAAHLLDKQFALSMTAAGTIRPATVVVLGAGVAGLQTIATAKRLGAIVRANDIREAAKGEVESLGADFIDLEAEADAQDEGGYAREVGDEFLAMQREILGRHLSDAHAVITTAVVPMKRAPVLVTQEMVDGMRPGSVLIDLAAIEGGNCELTPEEGQLDHGGVRIVAASDLASQMPREASSLYARNLLAVVREFHDDEAPDGLSIDREDEIAAAALVTIGGEVVHGPTAELLREEGTTGDR
jgi:H+-translocating NAD(P) transhydrogenase subunit alpha